MWTDENLIDLISPPKAYSLRAIINTDEQEKRSVERGICPIVELYL